MNDVINHRLYPSSVISYLALSKVDVERVFCTEKN